MKNDHELIGLIQHGSWFTVTFISGDHWESFKAQGIKKTREAITCHGVKHTTGTPFVTTPGIILSIFFQKSL